MAAYDHTEESLARHVRRAEQIAEEAQNAQELWADGLSARAEDAEVGDADAIEAIDAVLPPVPGPMCSWCDFRRHCPEGRDASTAIEPWSGLADTDSPPPEPTTAATCSATAPNRTISCASAPLTSAIPGTSRISSPR